MKKVKEYQTLIAGLALAFSIMGLVFRMGQAVEQHNHIIAAQGQMLGLIQERCR